MATPKVDVYFSFRSPYSYLALRQLLDWAKADDIDLRIRPVYPLAIRSKTFFKNLNPLGVPYVLMDAARVAEFHGIPYKFPDPDPVVMDMTTMQVATEQPYIHRLTRLAIEAGLQGKGTPFADKVSFLIWSGRQVPWDAGDNLDRAVAEAGLDLDGLDRAIDADPDRYEALIQQNQEDHKRAGHWGVPTMVYRGEPFFGQDRIDVLKWRVRQSR
jgi:2-hydroxychromene-2-carboxylate isomerase